jgi:hypothetical protein
LGNRAKGKDSIGKPDSIRRLDTARSAHRQSKAAVATTLGMALAAIAKFHGGQLFFHSAM